VIRLCSGWVLRRLLFTWWPCTLGLAFVMYGLQAVGARGAMVSIQNRVRGWCAEGE